MKNDGRDKYENERSILTRKEVSMLKKQVEELQKDNRFLLEEGRTQRDTIHQLRGALKKYGKCHWQCQRWAGSDYVNNVACTCGFAALIHTPENKS